MPRRDFPAIPTPPDTGNGDLNRVLNAIVENIELLTAQRGDANNHAVVKGDVDTAYPADPTVLDFDSFYSLRETVRKLMVNLKE